MRLLYGTYNPAKLAVMRRWLHELDLELVGLFELENLPDDVEETGSTPLENARIKAIAYQRATGMDVLSADSGLYINGLPEDQQPREHARRIAGKRLDDDEMIAHYAKLVHAQGGRMVAQYRNALCIAFADGQIIDRFDDSVSSKKFYLVDTPHEKRTNGFPLDSLSVDIISGEYYYDLHSVRADDDLAQETGYCRFVREALAAHDHKSL